MLLLLIPGCKITHLNLDRPSIYTYNNCILHHRWKHRYNDYLGALGANYYSLLYVMLGQDSLAHFCMGGKTLPEIRLRLFPGGGL